MLGPTRQFFPTLPLAQPAVLQQRLPLAVASTDRQPNLLGVQPVRLITTIRKAYLACWKSKI